MREKGTGNREQGTGMAAAAHYSKATKLFLFPAPLTIVERHTLTVYIRKS